MLRKRRADEGEPPYIPPVSGVRRLHVIGDPACGEEEERDDSAPLGLGIMMTARCGGSPSAVAPAVRARQRRPFIERHHQVELTIGMGMIVAAESIFRVVLIITGAVHIDSGNAEAEGRLRRIDKARSPVLMTRDFRIRGPALLFDTDSDQTGEILIQRASRTVFRVQPLLDFVSGGHVLDLFKKRNAASDQLLLVIGCIGV
ncbi:hypothetical protein AWV79_25565 [Cupriavidus sp. UYMMa02A]|nr:hypothetical protein AWV79_25565 [Cupriavidus sp. UYMMa02A]